MTSSHRKQEGEDQEEGLEDAAVGGPVLHLDVVVELQVVQTGIVLAQHLRDVLELVCFCYLNGFFPFTVD